MKITTYVFLLLFCTSTHAIVTIESLTINDSNLGLQSNINIDINGSSGNSDKAEGRVGSDWVWRTPQYINSVLFSYEYGESNQQTDTNNTFIHARHIRRHNNSLDVEYFVQTEDDEFARLNSRNLIGAGTRFAHSSNGFFGIGVLYFEERLDRLSNTNEALKDQGVRINTYLSGEYQHDDRTIFTARLYAQPKANALDDLRVLFNASLKLAITKNASIRIGLKSTHDSKPPEGVEKTDVYYSSGFEYSF